MTSRMIILGRLKPATIGGAPWGSPGDWRTDGRLTSGSWFTELGKYSIALETFQDEEYRVTVRRFTKKAIKVQGGDCLSGNIVFQSVPAEREEVAAQMFNCVVVGFRLGVSA